MRTLTFSFLLSSESHLPAFFFLSLTSTFVAKHDTVHSSGTIASKRGSNVTCPSHLLRQHTSAYRSVR